MEVPVQMTDLLQMSQAQLDDLFRRSQPGPIPEGVSTGQAIVRPGTFRARLIARFIYGFAWKGKVFTKTPTAKARRCRTGSRRRRQAIVARVYLTPSWLDGSHTSSGLFETSLFAPRSATRSESSTPSALYLGKVWWGKTRLIDFALTFPPQAS
jgi:hypothetical protein